ncbi:MAG: choice-of-anchor B family protein [Phycisphaerales bacterium JB059]
MYQGSRTSIALHLVATCGVLGGLASSSLGHDEDWRKLVDKQPPVFGPIWTADRADQSVDGADPRGLFDASGVTLLANIPINNFAGSHVDANDCWGYVTDSGREIAIMGLEAGFGIVDITNPTSPVILSTVPGPSSLWHDVKVIGDYAYGVSDQTGVGVQIMDLSDADNGNIRFVGNTTAGGFSTAHNIVANPESGRLFIVGGNVGNGGLVELDLSNPESPQIAGAWTQFYIHDAQVVSYTEGPFAGREIAFCNSGLDGGFTSTGLRIVDVTDPNNFFTVSTLFYSTPSYSHQGWLSPDRRYFYLNDELDENDGRVSTTTTRIIDVSDINNPFQAGTFTTGLGSIDHNLYTRDELIFESNYRTGLRIFDASDPLNPVEVAYFDTHPGSNGLGFNGAWSNFPFFPSGNVIVSDIERGLFVLDVDALNDRLVVSVASELPAAFPPAGGEEITIEIEELGLSVDPGRVKLHVIAGGPEVEAPGTNNLDGTWSFLTPPVACGSDATYWFTVESTTGEVYTLPADFPASQFSAPIASSAAVAFEDNFQTNMGWSVSGNASDGQWNRGVPVGGGDRGDPPSDFDGSGQCYLTDNVDGNSDVDSGSTTLTSPAMDATGGEAVLSYARWFSNTAGGSPNEDTMVVEISNNNGSTWQNLETVGPGGAEVSGGWYEKQFVINDLFATPSSQVRVRFTANDTGSGSVVEAGVDAVKITVLNCEDAPDCPADLAAPFGTLDFSDVVAFLGAFGSSDSAADLAPPFGTLDFSDVVAFLASFGSGCP